MRSINILGAALIAAASAVTAEDGGINAMPCFNDVCFTSWKCYYTRWTSEKIDNRCNVPRAAFTPAKDGSRWNTMVWELPYMVSWKTKWPQTDDDIVFEWLMFEAPGKPLPYTVANQTLEYSSDGPVNYIVAHSQNFSEATVAFAFTPSLKNFPNSHLNATPMAIQGYAMERNAFRIYHAKTFDPRNESTWDITDGFSVIREEEEKMIRRAAKNHIESGKKKLAIGVGVGVAVSWIVAFLVAWFASAWFQKRKSGHVSKTVQDD